MNDKDKSSQKDVRWQQRFNNFERAFRFLEKCVSIEHPSDVERAGLIQSYNLVFELSWLTMKDYLESQGVSDIDFPRKVIQHAFQGGIIEDGHLWMEVLKKRNEMAHTYEHMLSKETEKLIRNQYFPEMKKFYSLLKARCSD